MGSGTCHSLGLVSCLPSSVTGSLSSLGLSCRGLPFWVPVGLLCTPQLSCANLESFIRLLCASPLACARSEDRNRVWLRLLCSNLECTRGGPAEGVAEGVPRRAAGAGHPVCAWIGADDGPTAQPHRTAPSLQEGTGRAGRTWWILAALGEGWRRPRQVQAVEGPLKAKEGGSVTKVSESWKAVAPGETLLTGSWTSRCLLKRVLKTCRHGVAARSRRSGRLQRARVRQPSPTQSNRTTRDCGSKAESWGPGQRALLGGSPSPTARRPLGFGSLRFSFVFSETGGRGRSGLGVTMR